METWYAVYVTLTGQLVSLATVVADPLPQGLTAVALPERPNLTTHLWDGASHSFVPRPPATVVDRWTDLTTDPLFPEVQAVLALLGGATRSALQTSVTRLLGSQRYRDPNDPVTL